MNINNRGNNNRRRGRGGNRQQGSGSGQQLNRVDSRARGNAPQMLEKYRKLAHDAHLNGDRVQEETYHQYADHYFRVIADQRQRQDEVREQRQPSRWQEGGEQGQWREDGEEGGEESGEGEYSAYDQQQGNQRAARAAASPASQGERYREDRNHDERPREEARDDSSEGSEDRGGQFAPTENPFVRDNRNTRGPRPQRDDRERRPRTGQPARSPRNFDEPGEAQPLGLDPSLLPPAIAPTREEPAAAAPGDGEDKPRRRTRKVRPPADDAGEKLETVT